MVYIATRVVPIDKVSFRVSCEIRKVKTWKEKSIKMTQAFLGALKAEYTHEKMISYKRDCSNKLQVRNVSVFTRGSWTVRTVEEWICLMKQ